MLSLLLLSLLFIDVFSYPYTPVDNYLVDCGSTVNVTVDNRLFRSDSSNSDFFVSSSWTVSETDRIYTSARVFDRPSRYVFKIREKGTHMVRLHFSRLNSTEFDSHDVQFHVLVDKLVVLSNFSVDHSPLVKEYLIWLDTEKLLISFIPARKSKLAFINAIEVISAPRDLILETAQVVNGVEIEKFDGLNKQAFEVMYRVNVGGSKVTPFNDTLWRTWVPDDQFFRSFDVSRRVYTSGRIYYQDGGVTREVCPDNVYNTARVIASENASIPDAKMIWEFPVVEGYNYLVRLHFCDIASKSLGLLYFNVYVNENLVYKDLDLTTLVYQLAVPFYTDFVVDGRNHSGVLSVSIGPSNNSMPYVIDGILNGVEIMKMNKSMGILDGELCGGAILNSWPRRYTSFFFALVAAICVLLSLTVFTHKKKNQMRNSVPWSRLPTDVSDADLGNQNQQVKV